MTQKYQMEEKSVGGVTIKVYRGRPCNIYEMFQQTVDAYPEREAIVCGDLRLTYAELSKRVDSLAWVLKNNYHLGKGDRVAVFLRNDDCFVPVFLAVSKVGAISVVLNTRLKKAELEHQIGLTQPLLAIVDEEIWDKSLHGLVGQQIGRASLNEVWSTNQSCPAAPCNEEEVHTILFTSGTTGKPKGVKILHRNLIHSAIRLEHYMQTMGVDLSEGGKTLVAAPLFHVMALQEQLLPCFRLGGTAVLLPTFSTIGPLELIKSEKIEQLVGSPAMYRIILSFPDIKKYDFSCVKVVAFGAAPMSPDLIARLQETFVNARFFNGFGLTEASLSLACIDRECIDRPTSVGRPSYGCEVKIMDENMQEVPSGTIGEIAVKGPNVADGYYADPAETRKSFRNGWFLTGDLGRMDEEGFFYIASRKKDMINRGGEKVYPVEVENVISLHPKVFEVSVYGVPDEVMGEKVAASIVPVPGSTLTAEEIKEFCADKLAKYKIPEYIAFVTALPKNPGGKVVKEQLVQEFVSKLHQK